MGTDTPVIWRPTPKQAEFLAASEDEVLYGGAAGSGKSDGLVIDALGGQCGAVQQPEYRALVLRRSYPELREIIDRPSTRRSSQARYTSNRSGASLPSGARLELGYLDRDTDVMRYQSRQFQWIGWERAGTVADGLSLYLHARPSAPP